MESFVNVGGRLGGGPGGFIEDREDSDVCFGLMPHAALATGGGA